MEQKIRLDVIGLSYSESKKDSYVLILGEYGNSDNRRLPIIIGSNEAQAIAIELENMKAPRPLTHDLFKTVADTLGYTMLEAYIYKLEDGIFCSYLIIEHDGEVHAIDSRTSDAIALAVRFNCPITVSADIMQRASFSIDEAEQPEEPEPEPDDAAAQKLEQDILNDERVLDIIFDSTAELEAKLQAAIENEDYEFASLIRDELKNRNQSPR